MNAEFIKKKIVDNKVIKCLALMLIPLISCLFLCSVQGMSLAYVFLPNSEYNDEILYYKQIESILEYGIPQGYYGYNESFAKVFTFSSWSPIIIYPFALFAKVFTLGFFSPYIINMLFVAIAFLIFSLVYKPDWIEIAGLLGIFILFVPLSRYELSLMSEVEMLSLCIIYMAFYLKASKLNKNDEKISKRLTMTMYILAVVLSLMRPYFLLLLFFPSVYAARKNKKSIIVSVAILIGTVILYVIISYCFTAAYFIPLIQTKWLNDILTSPIAGIHQALSMFAYGVRLILGFFVQGTSEINMISGFWMFYMIITAVTVLDSFFDKEKWVWSAFLVLFAGAVIMFYDVNVGGRHLLPYTVMVLILLVTTEKKGKYFSLAFMLAIVFIFTIRMGNDTVAYSLPVYSDSLEAEIESLSSQTEGMMETDAAKWDNTMIWVWKDEDVSIHWNEFYGLPAGLGINMCTPEYVNENWGNLKSKYIASTPDGFVSVLCDRDGAELIAQTDKVCIWRIR